MGIWVVIGLAVLFAFYGISAYNRFVRLRNRADNAWSQTDVQLKKRWDLVPNLVETVKGYAAHERQTLEAVIQARNTAVGASNVEDQAQAENFLTGALRQLFAVSEAYPQLQADEGFRQLQSELSAIEQDIAVARQIYNDTVLKYNDAIQQFPAVVIARISGFTSREYFELSDGERTAPQVDFGG